MAIKKALAGVLCLGFFAVETFAAGSISRFSDEPLPHLDDDDLPGRTAPIIELGDAFLGNGNLARGFDLPTGAVWQPRFWVYGTWRSALQVYDPAQGAASVFEQFNRLDLFGNLQLSGSERALIGLRPLNRNGRFTGWQFEPEGNTEFQDEFNGLITTAFFEGDFGEIFPGLDPLDRADWDIGFSVGRQPINFQDGFLINDTLDSIGLTHNNHRFAAFDWLVNLRITTLFAWDEVHRNDNQEDQGAKLYGLFTSWDTVFGNKFASTIDIDFVVVDGTEGRGDLAVGGIGAVQRFGLNNLTVRALRSHDYGDDGFDTSASSDGELLFVELSRTPIGTHNIAYANAFFVNDDFTSAARDPLAGGPLSRTGVNFAARGIGTYPSPLSNRTSNTVGVAIGYQAFFDTNRRQLIVELAGRDNDSEKSTEPDSAAFNVIFQQKISPRVLIQIDGFVAIRGSDNDFNGVRAEVRIGL